MACEGGCHNKAGGELSNCFEYHRYEVVVSPPGQCGFKHWIRSGCEGIDSGTDSRVTTCLEAFPEGAA
jgi:hypothetical protein